MDKNRSKDRRRITLHEVPIVLLFIIGTVGIVTVLGMNLFSGKGKQECFNTDRNVLQEAVLAYRTYTGYFPTEGGAAGNIVWTGAIDLNGDGDVTDTHGIVSEGEAGLVTSGYLAEVPRSSTEAGGSYVWAIGGHGNIITPYQDGVYP